MNIIRRPFKYTFFNATLGLVIVNIAVFFLTTLFPTLKAYLGLSQLGLYSHFYWQFLTTLFVHDGIEHIVFNLITLFFIGTQVEKAIGSKEFLLFYFVCGIIESILSIVFYNFLGIYVFLIGASGAIYAVLLAYAVIFPRNKIYIWGILPISPPILILLYTLIAVFGQFFTKGGSISHISHLLGFFVAWIYFIVRMGIHPLKVWRENFR